MIPWNRIVNKFSVIRDRPQLLKINFMHIRYLNFWDEKTLIEKVGMILKDFEYPFENSKKKFYFLA